MHNFTWLNPPPRHEHDEVAGVLRVWPAAETDFWQRTHYGFRADSGHFFHRQVGGDFLLSAHIRFEPVHQYDQAGLMVRLSADCWLKTSVEYEPDGPSRLGAVVTNHGYSDWSTQDVPADLRAIHLQIRRAAADYHVAASHDGQSWTQLRIAHLHEGDATSPVTAGLYACSPKAAGFAAEFGDVALTTHDS